MRPQKVAKLIISFALFSGLFFFIDGDALVETLQKFSVGLLVSIFIGYIAGQILSAYKWWIILKSASINASFPLTLKAYFIGMFANILGIGTVGGDLTRALIIASGKNTTRIRILGTVAADRGHGLAILASIGFLMTLIYPNNALPGLLILTMIVLAASVVIGWFVVVYGISRVQRPKWIPEKIFRLVSEAVNALPKAPSIVAYITLISFCFHLLQITLQWLLIRELQGATSFLFILSVIPYVNIVSTLPLSWQGLGIRENAYIFFLVPAVMATAEAVAVGTVWFLIVTAAGGLGGIWAVLSNDWRIIWQKNNKAIASQTQNGTSSVQTLQT
jgi:glycosyltransferase 2 family protein